MADGDGVIETGVDKLVTFLRREGSVKVNEAADSLGVDEETIMRWATALEENDLARITYTTRRGRVIKPVDLETDADKEEQPELGEIDELLAQEGRLERYEIVLERLKQELEQDESTADTLRKQEAIQEHIDELERYLDDLEAAEEDVAELRARLEDVRADIDALSAVSGGIEPADRGLLERIPVIGRFFRQQPAAADGAADASDSAGEASDGDAGEKTYTCERCGDTFTAPVQKAQHVRLEHADGAAAGTGTPGDEDEPAAETATETVAASEQIADDTGKTYKCDECGDTFNAPIEKAQHIRLEHPEA